MKTVGGVALIVVALAGVGWTVSALPGQPPDGRLAFVAGGMALSCLFAVAGAWLLLAGLRRERPRPPEDDQPYDPFAERPHRSNRP